MHSEGGGLRETGARGLIQQTPVTKIHKIALQLFYHISCGFHIQFYESNAQKFDKILIPNHIVISAQGCYAFDVGGGGDNDDGSIWKILVQRKGPY